MIRIAFIRHGRTGWNREGRIQGRIDQPLDAEGRAELEALCAPSEWRHAELVASPLKRAADTAAIVFDRAPVLEPALIELDWGAWEGRKGADLLAEAAPGFRPIEEWGWGFKPLGGERLSSLRDRVAGWMAGRTQDTIAVAHIGVMRVALALATGWAFQGPAPFRIRRRRLYPIVMEGGAPVRAEEPIRLPQRGDAP